MDDAYPELETGIKSIWNFAGWRQSASLSLKCQLHSLLDTLGDVDLALYDGFLNDSDRPLLARVYDASPQELAQTHFDFHDERLPELLFRYRARNWPETLSVEEAQRWAQFCIHRIQDADGGGSITLKDYYARIALLRDEREGNMDVQKILDALEEWGALSKLS